MAELSYSSYVITCTKNKYKLSRTDINIFDTIPKIKLNRTEVEFYRQRIDIINRKVWKVEENTPNFMKYTIASIHSGESEMFNLRIIVHKHESYIFAAIFKYYHKLMAIGITGYSGLKPIDNSTIKSFKNWIIKNEKEFLCNTKIKDILTLIHDT